MTKDAWSGSPPLLISSVNGGGVFHIGGDGRLEAWSRVDTTGIATQPNGALLLARQAEGRAELRRLHAGDVHRIELVDRSLDLHDLYAEGERLLVVATQINTVFEFDLEFLETRHWSFPGEEDSQHLNSVCVHDGRIIASRFGQFARTRGYSGASRGTGEVFDVECGDVLLAGLSQPHSLTPCDDGLWLCDSETRRILLVRDGVIVSERELDGYTRGMAVVGDDLFVGISASRNADSGGRQHAEIVRLDRRTFEERGRVQIPAKEVYDIVALAVDRVGPLREAAFKDAIAEYDTQVHECNTRVAAVQADARAALRARDEVVTLRERAAVSEAERVRMASALRQQVLLADSLSARLQEEVEWATALEACVGDISERLSTLQGMHAEALVALAERDRVIAHLEAWQRQGAQAIQERDARIADADARLAAIEASRAWRWTRPFRPKEEAYAPAMPMPAPSLGGFEPPAAFTREHDPAANPVVPLRSSTAIRGIAFVDEPAPVVSVIVSAFGGFDMTRRCLEALQADTLAPPMEVILVEDASGEPEMDRFATIPGLRYMRHEANLGYLRSMNGALGHVRGKYTCFLNNDCIVREGSLQALLRPFDLFHDCGIAGARLEFPGGGLQEAGGIVWNDGSACNYGHGRKGISVSDATMREVDYVSAAAAVVPTHLLNQLGGFDDRYAPAYYEDTDLAFRLRQLGYRAYYAPGAVIEHQGGATHGVVEGEGLKRHQALNRVVFRERWQDVLQREQLPPGQHPFLARSRAQMRVSVLVLDAAPPRPDRDAGSRAVWHAMQTLRRLDADVRFWSHAIVEDALASELLAIHGYELFDEARAGCVFAAWWRDHAPYFDMVVVNRPAIASAHLPTLRRHGDPVIVYYGHDIHQLRLQREAQLSRDPATHAAAERVGTVERAAWLRSDVILYPTDEETAIVTSFLRDQGHPGPCAMTAPLLVMDGDPRPPDRVGATSLSERRDLLFVGGFSHAPNRDGVEWFLSECWPALRASERGMRLVVVGDGAPEHLLARAAPNVVFASNLSEHELAARYADARVAIAPLRYGAGLKGKVIEAMHHGVPCVTTSVGAEGLSGAPALRVADAPAAFAAQVLELWDDPAAWREASEDGRRFVAATFSSEVSQRFWGQLLHPLRRASVAERLESIKQRSEFDAQRPEVGER